MKASIGIECGWANPEALSQLFLDDFDHYGMFFWAKYIHEQNNKIKDTK